MNELQPELHQSLSHPVHSSVTQDQWENYFYWVALTFISPIHAFLTWVHGQILTLTEENVSMVKQVFAFHELFLSDRVHRKSLRPCDGVGLRCVYL